MKKSYKLIGVEWDHYHLPCKLPPFVHEKEVQLHSVEKNLFDFVCYERRIDISEALNNTQSYLSEAIDKIKDCDCVYIRINYEPETCANDIRLFYCLRVLQIIAFIDDKLENTGTKFAVMASDKAKDMINDFWNMKNNNLSVR